MGILFWCMLVFLLPSLVDASHVTPLTIDDNTWVVRTIPGTPTSLMGVHGTLGRGGGKHVNFEMSSVDHKVYIMGGDAGNYVLPNGQIPNNSNRQEVYSYDIKNDVWTQEHPFCAGPGEVAPAQPDWNPWIWDSTREKFWFFGGGGQCFAGVCDTTFIRDTLCATISDGTTVYTDRLNHWFNPLTGQFETPSINGHDSSNIQELFSRSTSNALLDGIYDPVNDDFWFPLGCNWTCIYRYDPSTDTDPSSLATSGWTKFEMLVGQQTPTFLETRPTFNPTSRKMYLVSEGLGSDPTGDILYSFDIDTQVLTNLGKVPGSLSGHKDGVILYNSVEDVLMFPAHDEAEWAAVQLYVYHLSGAFAGQWEGIDMTVPHADAEVHGRHWIFDPYNNVLMGTGASNDYQPRIYLYRYAAPASLHPFDTVLPGRWYRVDNSQALDRRPDITNVAIDPEGGCVGNISHSQGSCGQSGPVAVTHAWGGGGFDYRRSHYYLWGGGHGDYLGNEVYKLDLNLIDGVQAINPWVLERDMDVPYNSGLTELDDVSGETRLKACTGPASGPFIATNCFPGSVHSYDQIEYIGQDFDYICNFSNSAARGGARKNIYSFCYDPTVQQWHRLPDNVAGATGAQAITGYDRFHHRLIYKASESGFWLSQFEPRYQLFGAASWTGVSKTTSPGVDFSLPVGYTGVMAQWETQGVDEFVRFLAIGRKNSTGYNLCCPAAPFAWGDPDLIYYDLGLTNANESPTQLTPTGDLGIFNLTKNIGADFDATTHKVVMWNGGCDVYVMDPQTFFIERQIPSAGNVECPAQLSGFVTAGYFNRWRYLPRWNGYLVASQMDDDVWFYKLGSDTDSTPPQQVQNFQAVP